MALEALIFLAIARTVLMKLPPLIIAAIGAFSLATGQIAFSLVSLTLFGQVRHATR